MHLILRGSDHVKKDRKKKTKKKTMHESESRGGEKDANATV